MTVRLSRRSLIASLMVGGIGASASVGTPGALAAGAESRGSDDVVQIAIEAKPIPALLSREPDRRRFGELEFRSGVVLSSEYDGFGGWSGLWRSDDGARLVSVSDNAQWLTGNPTYDGEGRLSGLADAVQAPLLDEDGRPLRHTPAFDTESLAIADGVAYVGIERVHEVRRFGWASSGVRARGVPVPVPPEMKQLPYNESLEAVGVPGTGHPLAGCVIAIAERARYGDEAPTRGWVLTGATPFTFDVARSKGFDITDIAFLPSGDALLLERRFRIVTGVACRIRRLGVAAFTAGALVDGPVLFEADRSYEIDNMEGIATHRDPRTGDTVVTLISDDNFSFLQRTVLLEFVLRDA